MSKGLPARPHLDYLKHEAKALVRAFAARVPEAVGRVEAVLGPRTALRLTDAQRVVAREYGFASWARLRTRVAASRGVGAAVDTFLKAVLDQSRSRAEQVLTTEPTIARVSPAVAAALGRVRELGDLLDADPGSVERAEGDPPSSPLAWLCFSPYHGVSEALDAELAACARLLLDRGADPNVRATRYALPALYAVTGQSNVPVIARMLLEAGARPTDGESVHHAAERYHEEALALLLEFGVELNQVGDWGNTPLYFLHRYWDVERHPAVGRGIRWLLDHGADPNIRSGAERETALHAAVRQGQSPDVIRLLLDRGADPRAERGDGRSAWLLARRSGQAALATVLELAGALPTPLSPADQLLEACASGSVGLAEQLATPALLRELDPEDLRLLRDAARRGDIPVVQACLAAGFPVNGLDEFGATPLHHAAIAGRAQVVSVLLPVGADLRIRDHEHRATPLEWAQFGAQHIRELDGDYPATIAALSSRPVGTESGGSEPNC